MENLLMRITLNPNVNHGQPGSGIPDIWRKLSLNTLRRRYRRGLFAECPDLEREDISLVLPMLLPQ